MAWTTNKGSTSGLLTSLSLLDQKGFENNPQAYVVFQTPNSIYNGYQSFILPSDVKPLQVTAMALELNYKSPAPSVQVWTISIYDWKAKKWIEIGVTNVDSSKEWRRHTFTLPYQARYISTKGEIRILLKSNNADGDALLDYEAIQIGVGALLQNTSNSVGITATSAVLTATQGSTALPSATMASPTMTVTTTPDP
jgi:hypothetical protein